MLWRDAGALVLFRENAQKAAATYLGSQNVKLSSARKRTKHIRDGSAYRASQEDSKKIDVKRRRIEGRAEDVGDQRRTYLQRCSALALD